MNFKLDMKSMLIIIIIILLVRGLVSLDRETFMTTLYTLPGLVLAITVHEYSHARTSDKYGDPTPEREGRLTLNPLAHLDPVGTICLLFAGFGWGKPVKIDPTYYRNPAKESMKVALAGPVSNFILAVIMTLLYGVVLFLVESGIVEITKTLQILATIILCSVFVNISLGLFNLLPFPPLDGSKIFGYFLKGKAKEVLYTLEHYSQIIIIVLFITEIPSIILRPLVNGLATLMMGVVEKIVALLV